MDYEYIYRKFCYVDSHISGSGEKWRRVKTTDIESQVRIPASNHNCMISIQRFSQARHNTEGREEQFCPIYFDLDKNEEAIRPEDRTTFDDVRDDVKKIIGFFHDNYGMSRKEIRTWFSGSKGAHITINPVSLGITPHEELTLIIKLACMELKELLDLKTLDYKSIYSIRRQWRLHNSVHPKTKAYKIELTWDDWNKSLEDIKAMATEPNEAFYTEADELNTPLNMRAHEWFGKFIAYHESMKRLEKLRPRKPILKTDKIPVCVQAILDSNELLIPKTGNQVSMTLATYFKDSGRSREDTIKILSKWAENLKGVSTSGSKHKARASIISVVNSIFTDAGKNYHFSCAYMKSLGTAEKPVQCAWSRCDVIVEKDQEPAESLNTSLYEATHASYNLQRVQIPVIIAGKNDKPYTIPMTISAVCYAAGECDKPCRIKDNSGRLEHSFSIRNPETLRLLKVPNSTQRKVMRELAGINTSCYKCDIEIKKEINVEEVELIPQIDSERDSSEYVYRHAFFFGYGLQTNKRYQIAAYPMPDPRDQTTVFTFSEFKSNTEDFKCFRMTPEIYELLKIFQVDPSQDMGVQDKMLDIHRDFEANVHKIVHRYEVGIGVDMVYHSVINFRFMDEYVGRGWTEMLVIGDSGQGKSKLIKGLHRHYGLGTWIMGESTSRTGLVYGITKTGDRWHFIWGSLPLSDGSIAIIDEFSGVPPEEFAQMSEMRQTGIARIQKIVSAETSARVRMIYMSNPRQGCHLEDFAYGCEAIVGRTGLMPHREDARRLDFALAVCSGDIDPDIINKRRDEKQEHKYTASLCNMLIRWAWSRKPEDVLFMPEAEDLILKFATDMGNEYSSSIPLVEAADQRIKLARLAVATATRVFSTDETGEKVIVRAEHVIFVYKYLKSLYMADGLGYWLYSEKDRKLKKITPEREADIIYEIESLRIATWNDLSDTLLSMGEISARNLEEAMALDYSAAKELLKKLRQLDLIKDSGNRNGYHKTQLLAKMLKRKRKKDVNVKSFKLF